MKKQEIKGLYAPLVTPFYHGKFDAESMKKVMQSMEQYVSGYVPCLSSGEGQKLTEKEWEQVIGTVVKSTTKPVYAGIKNLDQCDVLIPKAKQLGCAGVIMPAPKGDVVIYFSKLARKHNFPMIVYNTEGASITSLEVVKQLDEIDQVMAIKDSSMNMPFFHEMVSLRKQGKLEMGVLQGMEHLLGKSTGCDGYLISLLNVEPALCKKMFAEPTEATDDMIKEKFWEYNLGGTWYITLKSLLYAKGTIKSAEEVSVEVKP